MSNPFHSNPLISSPHSPPSPDHQSIFSTSESDSLKGFLEQFAADPILISHKSYPKLNQSNMLINKSSTSNSNHLHFNQNPSSNFITTSQKHQPISSTLTTHPYHPINPSQPHSLELEYEPQDRYYSSSKSNSDSTSIQLIHLNDSQLIQTVRPNKPLSPNEQQPLTTTQPINSNHHHPTTYISPSNLKTFHHHPSIKSDKTNEHDQVGEMPPWFKDSSTTTPTTTDTTGQYILPSTHQNSHSQKLNSLPLPPPIIHHRHRQHHSIDSSIERSRLDSPNPTSSSSLQSRSSLPTSNLFIPTHQLIKQTSSSSITTTHSSSIPRSHIKKSLNLTENSSKKEKVGLLSQEQKRANHIASEQKRRAAIRLGYDKLCEVVPSLKSSTLNQDSHHLITNKDLNEVNLMNLNLKNNHDRKKRKKSILEESNHLKVLDNRSNGPKSEAIVLAQTVEYLRELEEERKKLLNQLKLTQTFLKQNGVKIEPDDDDHHNNNERCRNKKMIWEEKWDSNLHV